MTVIPIGYRVMSIPGCGIRNNLIFASLEMENCVSHPVILG